MSCGLPTKMARSRTRGMTLDVADHLGVVVGRQKGLALAAVRHRHEADEVGEPRQLGFLQFGVLVPVLVDVPGFVGDHQVVAALVDGILEDHEVGDQHLVHAAQRLEAVQVVLAQFELDVPRLAGQQRAQRMDAFAAGRQQARHRVLRQPVDLEVRMELAQLARDGDIASRRGRGRSARRDRAPAWSRAVRPRRPVCAGVRAQAEFARRGNP